MFFILILGCVENSVNGLNVRKGQKTRPNYSQFAIQFP